MVEDEISSQVAENGSAVSSVTELNPGDVDSAVPEPEESPGNVESEAPKELSSTATVDKYVCCNLFP